MKFINFTLILGFLFIGLPFLSAQQIENVTVSTTDEKLIVAYDLEGKQNTLYDVALRFQMDDGSIVTPKSVNGDIGKVEAGKSKAIVWDVYDDINGIEGKITPLLDAKEVVKRDPKQTTTTQPTPTPPAPPKRTVDVGKKKKKNKMQQTYRAGVKAAWGNTSVESNLRRNTFIKENSWQAGGFFRWTFKKRMYIQPEILYHKQAYEEVYNNVENAISNNHYARGQVLLGFAPFGFGLYVNGGVYYGHLLGANEKRFLTSGTEEITLQNVEPRNGQDAPFLNGDLGYLVGGSFSIFKGSFAVGVLYSGGFASFINDEYYEGDAVNDNLNLTNRGVHFYIQKAL